MHVLEAALVANLAPLPERRRARAEARSRWLKPCRLVRLATAVALLLPLALLLAGG